MRSHCIVVDSFSFGMERLSKENSKSLCKIKANAQRKVKTIEITLEMLHVTHRGSERRNAPGGVPRTEQLKSPCFRKRVVLSGHTLLTTKLLPANG